MKVEVNQEIFCEKSEYYDKNNEDKLLIVIGNGPSTKNLNFNIIKNNKDKIHTIGMNSAYRKYNDIDYFPNYYSGWDYVVTNDHKDNFTKCIKENKNTKFFFVSNFYSFFSKDEINLQNVLNEKHIINKYDLNNLNINEHNLEEKSNNLFYNVTKEDDINFIGNLQGTNFVLINDIELSKDFIDLLNSKKNIKYFVTSEVFYKKSYIINKINISKYVYKQIFDENIKNLDNFIVNNHYYKHHIKNSENLDNIMSLNTKNFLDMGNTGANSLVIGLSLGYKKILLIGCDANYVEFVSGSKLVKNRLIIENEKENTNTNYWFDGYQKKGDKYNIPQTDKWQIPGWNKVGNLYKKYYPTAEILNVSKISRLECFDFSDLDEEINKYLNS